MTHAMNYAPKLVLGLPISDLRILDSFVERCIRDRVCLIAVVGPDASKVHDIIDEIIVGDGSDPSRFIATTFHEDEAIEDVLDFARLYEQERDERVQLVRL
ncbi:MULTISPECIES: hypothetical protein [unclassified Bradyrhizobium]|uniref:hypothetical protein n=1 Tax=unclassified Bradyrhizobium TaxID=2631580 RepID=UPI0028EA7262|nr:MULTISPECIES: hypothetical protein [unclassified Bradyrhizobium]